MPQNSIKLSFCQIIMIDEFTIEVIPKAGIEVGEAEINEYHRFFNQLAHPVNVLVNRSNSYSYSFAALLKIAVNKNMLAAAILLKDSSKIPEAEYIASAMKGGLLIQIFTDRSLALNWLRDQRVS